MLNHIKAACGIGNRKEFTIKEEDGFTTLEAQKGSQIRSLDDLLEVAEIDLEKYEVVKHVANVWNTFSGQHGLVDLWQVKAWLQRKPITPEEVKKIVAEGLRGVKLAKDVLRKVVKSGKMVEFAIPDLHLGKHAWDEETGGGNWDLKIAEQTFKECLEDLISKAPKDAEEAVFVLGNDFFNVDNTSYETSAGTLQDEDGRWQKSFRKGQALVIWAIERLKKAYPKVKVVVVYGNHDNQRTFYLGEIVRQLYSGSKTVTVDNSPKARKYISWGETLIGLTHGDRIKFSDLAHLAQNEARELWGKTKRCEYHLGHFHHDAVKEFAGVKIRIIPSLCPPDAWHAKSGYTTSERAAMAFVYDKKALQSILYAYPTHNQE